MIEFNPMRQPPVASRDDGVLAAGFYPSAASRTSNRPLPDGDAVAPAGMQLVLTCQRSDVDLVSVGDAVEAEKDRLLEKVWD